MEPNKKESNPCEKEETLQESFLTKKEKDLLRKKEKQLNKLNKKKLQLIEEIPAERKTEKEEQPVIEEKHPTIVEEYPVAEEAKLVVEVKMENILRKEGIDIIGTLSSGIDAILNKLKERESSWKSRIKTMDQELLVKCDMKQGSNILILIINVKNIIKALGENIYKKIQPAVMRLLASLERKNKEITKLHIKELRLKELMCYKFRNKSLSYIGKIHKEKKFIVKNINHKTTKKKPEIKKLTSLLSRTDFLNRSKLWIIQFNLMKEKFKCKRELNNYQMEKTENILKKKLKKEKNYKLIRLIKQKRKDPIRRAQIDHLIKEHKRNIFTFQKNKKIMVKHQKLVEMHAAVVLDGDWSPQQKKCEVDNGTVSLVDKSGGILFYTEEEIKRMNDFFRNCYLISMKNKLSILDTIKDPEIDTEDRFGPKLDLLEEMYFLLHTISPCTLR